MLYWDKDKGEVLPSPFLYDISAFEEVLAHKDARKIITFIHHMNAPLSPYIQYGEKKRVEKLVDDVFDGDYTVVCSLEQYPFQTGEIDDDGEPVIEMRDKYVPLNFVKKATDYYLDLVENSTTRALKAAHSALHKIREFFNDVNFKERTNSGSAVYKPKDILSAMGQLPEAEKNLIELEESVRKQEKDEDRKLRGGVKINPFNSGE